MGVKFKLFQKKNFIFSRTSTYISVYILQLHYNAVAGVHRKKRVITDRIINTALYTRDRCSKSRT